MRLFHKSVAASLCLVFLLLVLVVFVPENASADTNTWTSDADWLSGTMDTSLVLQGTGDPAYLELKKGDFPDWQKMAPGTVPRARDGYCLAWVDVGNYVLMFGGYVAGGPTGDTWKYNFTTDAWTELVLGTHPSNRTYAGCDYDPDNQVVVLFGGLDSTFTWSTQTWEFDVNTQTWSMANPPTGNPRNLLTTPMTYDTQANRILMIGQNTVTGTMETWAYNAATDEWALRTTNFPGAIRDGHAIAYDVGRDRTFLFSGAQDLTMFCDMYDYAYASNTWAFIRTCLINEDPNARIGHDMVYRQSYNGILLFGGVNGSAYPPETWVYLPNGDFYLPPITGSPGGRKNIQIGHSPVDDVSVFFGGDNQNPGYLNDTWALAKGYIVNVDAVWTSSAAPVDTGCDNPNYDRIFWNSTSNPVGAILRFQIATSDSVGGPWTFRGVQGFPGDHYTVWGSYIHNGSNDNNRYFRALAKLKTTNGRVTPHLEDLSITYVCPVTPPTITNTNPASGATGVPRNAAIWVNFSEPMNQATVTWTISGGITATDSWFNGGRTLRLTPTTLFEECRDYTAAITGGKDINDNLDLVPGPVPNPWTFTVACVNPFIVTTDPAANGVGVALDKVINVTFSEAMNTSSVFWTISGGITLSGAWDASETVLSLTPSPNFATCTVYIAEITQGLDKQDLPLGPGPVPNPWTFQTRGCPLTAPAGLTVTRQSPNSIALDWQDVGPATGYRVYTSQNRFAPFPSGWTLADSPTGSASSIPNHLTDGLTHYYIVRATDGATEGPNSSMGVKVPLSFTYSATRTNIAWLSLPYAPGYTRASDIANELGTTRIDVIGKWDPAKQSAATYFFSRGRWRGTDFTLSPGNGLYIGLRSSFTWVVVGTDLDAGLNFQFNAPPKTNVNWISVPYTGTYNSASDIANELTSTKITEVGLWNTATQTSTLWFWDGSAWTGTDFAIAPGDGVYLRIASSFGWSPALITPAVP